MHIRFYSFILDWISFSATAAMILFLEQCSSGKRDDVFNQFLWLKQIHAVSGKINAIYSLSLFVLIWFVSIFNEFPFGSLEMYEIVFTKV